MPRSVVVPSGFPPIPRPAPGDGPDLAGFAAAQQELRDQFGEPVVFLGEASVTFPPGTPLDPETGTPYDPTIVASSSVAASAGVLCNIVFRAVNRAGVGGETDFAAPGIVEQNHIMCIAPSGAASAIVGSVSFLAREELYQVTATKFDGVGELQRILAYGRRR